MHYMLNIDLHGIKYPFERTEENGVYKTHWTKFFYSFITPADVKMKFHPKALIFFGNNVKS